MKIKISKTWLVVIIIIVLIVGYNVVKPLFKSPVEGLITEKIQKGEVLQEISETGSVKATQNVSLGFKSVGKIANINVSVGDSVKRGDVLASLDSGQLLAQLQSAKAALKYTTSQYDSGVATAKDNLQSAYNSATNTLNDAHNKIYNAYNTVVSLNNLYFATNDQEGIRASEAQRDISNNMQNIKGYLEKDVDFAVPEMLVALNNVYNDLKIIRDQCDIGVYYSKVASADKTSLDTQKTNINTAITNVTNSQNDISSYKIALKKAEDSTIEQAQADVDALQSQLNDNYLVSPINGRITSVDIKRGQIVSPSQSAINLLSSEPFEIKVNIYEQDIVNVKVGDNVKINLVAFPRQTFEGRVLSIDPAETIVENVIYYQVTIEFPNQPQGIKSGMTADIVIQTNKKEDVLRVPKNAVVQINGAGTVQIFRNNKIENIEITTGLEGNDYFEVLSGLSESEIIITGKK